MTNLIIVSESNIIYRMQSGFRSDFSTDTFLSYHHNKILKGFYKGKYAGMILTDLQKKFDPIDNKILLKKIKCIDLSGSATCWIKSYFANRIYFVEIEEECK